jgi:hypothetical protein
MQLPVAPKKFHWPKWSLDLRGSPYITEPAKTEKLYQIFETTIFLVFKNRLKQTLFVVSFENTYAKDVLILNN